MNTNLARHLVLCEMLGIGTAEENEDEGDPLGSLDAISIDDFKD